MDFTIYETATGAILRSGYCPDADIDRQAGDGESVWPGERLDDTKWKIVSGQKTAIGIDLEQLEAALCAAVDRSAENVRAAFVTNTASQAGVYLTKEAEARAYLGDDGVSEALTPHLSREAARLGVSRGAAATVIVEKATQWKTVSAIIEDIRLRGKDAIRAATTEETKRAAASIDWSPALAFAE